MSGFATEILVRTSTPVICVNDRFLKMQGAGWIAAASASSAPVSSQWISANAILIAWIGWRVWTTCHPSTSTPLARTLDTPSIVSSRRSTTVVSKLGWLSDTSHGVHMRPHREAPGHHEVA